MIILAAAHFAWAGAQVKPVDDRISKMKLTATELAHYMAPGVNLGNTMEACDWNDVFTNQAGLKSETSWQNDKTTESYIRSLKQQGFTPRTYPPSASELVAPMEWSWALKRKPPFLPEMEPSPS